VIKFILASTLGAALFGIFALGETIIAVTGRIGRLGMDKSIVRFLPGYEDDRHRQNKVLGIAYLFAILASVSIAASLFFLAPVISSHTLNDPLFVKTLQVLVFYLPAQTLTRITTSVFRSIEDMHLQVATLDVFSPLIRLFSIGIALLLGASLVGVVAAFTASMILILFFAIALFVSYTPFRPIPSIDFEMSRTVINYAFPLSMKDIGSFLYIQVDIFLIGILMTGVDVGIYKAATILMTVLVLPFNSLKQLFPPIISRLYSNGKIEELEQVYKVVTRWALTSTLILCIGLGAFRSEILGLFGAEYVAGSTVLLILIGGQIVNAFVGPSGLILMMTDHQYATLVNGWVFGGFNVVTNYILIGHFGIIGAAIATTLTISLINLIRIVEVWYFEGLLPYSKQLIRPFIAGIFSIIGIFLIKRLLTGIPSMLAGGIFGSILYLLVLYAQGIDDSDRRVYRELIS